MSDTFTRDDVERIARLARIDLTDDEKALVTPQLSNFLAYAVQVQQVVTSGVPPTSHPLGTTGGGREETPQPSLPREEVLAQAPESDPSAGLFKVPRVLA